MHALMLSAAEQHQADSSLVPLHSQPKVLLFLQGCNHKPKMHCSRIHIKIRALLLSVAEQNQADSSLVLLQLQPKGFALLTRVRSQT